MTPPPMTRTRAGRQRRHAGARRRGRVDRGSSARPPDHTTGSRAGNTPPVPAAVKRTHMRCGRRRGIRVSPALDAPRRPSWTRAGWVPRRRTRTSPSPPPFPDSPPPPSLFSPPPYLLPLRTRGGCRHPAPAPGAGVRRPWPRRGSSGLSDHQWRLKGLRRQTQTVRTLTEPGSATSGGPVRPGPTGGCAFSHVPRLSSGAFRSSAPEGQEDLDVIRPPGAVASSGTAASRTTARNGASRGPRRAAGDLPRRHRVDLGEVMASGLDTPSLVGRGTRSRTAGRWRPSPMFSPGSGTRRHPVAQPDANRNGPLTDEGWRVLEIFSQESSTRRRRVQTSPASPDPRPRPHHPADR